MTDDLGQLRGYMRGWLACDEVANDERVHWESRRDFRRLQREIEAEIATLIAERKASEVAS